jgi:hypothetical protein
MFFRQLAIEHFKKSKQAVLCDSLHVLDIDNLYLEDLIEFKKNQGTTRACVLLLALEPPYFDPGSNISRQWVQFKDVLLKHQIFNCDFFVTCMFCNSSHDDSIEYLNKNHYDWSFLKFDIDLTYINDIEVTYADIPKTKKKINKLESTGTELFLEECHMKFSHLNFTHRMHRQLFSKFLIKEELVRDNLVAINPFRKDVVEAKNYIPKDENRLIEIDLDNGWFYNKHLLDLWRDVPLEYYRHPDIDDGYDAMNLTFLNKASFNIVSETVFDYPAPFCTEKTTQSLMSKRPFIMIGPCGNLQHLRDRGFKTFHSIINESYDDIEDPNKRLEAVMQLVLELDKKSQQELNDMVYAVKDTLIHNHSLILEKKRNFTNITE